MALMDKHIQEQKTSLVSTKSTSSQDETIARLKSLLSPSELDIAVKTYHKYLYLFEDSKLRIGSTSHQELLKQLWISALETRVDLDPLLF